VSTTTRRQIAALNDFPITLWDDRPAQAAAVRQLRDRCAEIAAGEGYQLASDGTESQYALFMRITDGSDGEPIAVECAREQAEFVRLRLAVWAVPA
jgi:hypothetical protein